MARLDFDYLSIERHIRDHCSRQYWGAKQPLQEARFRLRGHRRSLDLRFSCAAASPLTTLGYRNPAEDRGIHRWFSHPLSSVRPITRTPTKRKIEPRSTRFRQFYITNSQHLRIRESRAWVVKSPLTLLRSVRWTRYMTNRAGRQNQSRAR